MTDEKFFINNAEEITPRKNDSPYKRVLAIGDVHGQFGALKSLWKKLEVTDEDLIIFLGDYIDRGREVAEVLKWVIERSELKNYIFLRGNHEQMMINTLNPNSTDKITWLINGGKATAIALRGLIEEKIFSLEEILDFVKNLPLSYSVEVGGLKYFFCHAGVQDGVPLEEQDENYLLWSREAFFDHYSGDDVIISGHSPIKLFFDFDTINPRPIKVPGRNILMLDTGAFISGGRLSAVDILSGQYWQNGQDKQGDIIFICAGNTCRSPMAKYIMRHFLKLARLDKKILIDSAGCFTSGGSFMSAAACDTLKGNEIEFALHISKAFTTREYQNYKSVIALDEHVLERAKEISGGDPDNKIQLFKDSAGNEFGVDDPFGTGDYEKAFSEILRGCEVLLRKVAQ